VKRLLPVPGKNCVTDVPTGAVIPERIFLVRRLRDPDELTTPDLANVTNLVTDPTGIRLPAKNKNLAVNLVIVPVGDSKPALNTLVRLTTDPLGERLPDKVNKSARRKLGVPVGFSVPPLNKLGRLTIEPVGD
jgi:hypothetical protein